MSKQGKNGVVTFKKVIKDNDQESVKMEVFTSKNFGTDLSVPDEHIASFEMSLCEFASAMTSMVVKREIGVKMNSSFLDREDVIDEKDVDKFLKVLKEFMKDVQKILNGKNYVGKRDRMRITDRITKVVSAVKSAGFLDSEKIFSEEKQHLNGTTIKSSTTELLPV